MDNQEKIKLMAKYFPIILELKDEKVAGMVADVWLSMLEASIWDDISQARFKEGYDNVSLISHVNSAIECALAIAKIVGKYHDISFDTQKIITFGLLHDVDKMVEYVFDKDGNLVVSDLGKRIQHGCLSAMYARDAGFDMDMIHLILTHTSASSIRTTDKEGILFGHADICDWDLTCRFTEH